MFMRSGKLTLLILAAGLLPALAGAQDAPHRRLDPCTLVTASEISEVMGIKVNPGSGHDDGLTRLGSYASTCVWVVPLPAGVKPNPQLPLGGADFAMLNVMTWPSGGEDAKAYLEDFRSSAEAHLIAKTPIDLEIGDEALWWGNGVAVRKGAVSFGVAVWLGARDNREMEETLARTIVERL